MDRQFNQWGCRDDLAVNSTRGSFRGPEFSSPASMYDGSQPSEESSENLKHSLAPLGTCECIDTQSQTKEN